MNVPSLVNLVAGFFIVMLLAGIIFFRIRLGGSKSEDSSKSATRRNSFVIAFVVLVFIMYWIYLYQTGRFAEEGIVGWKKYAAGIVFAVGVCSFILLLISTFRRK